MTPNGKAAVGYATRLGWSVFPVAANGRTPIKDEALGLAHGCRDATNMPDLLESWWDAHPGANVALACGLLSGGLVVVDVDTKDGKDGLASLTALEALHAPLPKTWQSATPSGGQHRFFKGPDRVIRNAVNLGVTQPDGSKIKYDGIDIRADGGSVCLPPSVRPDGAYAWTVHPTSMPIAQLPEWLEKIVDPPQASRPPAEPLRLDSTERITRYVVAVIEAECGELGRMGPASGRNLKLFQASANLYSLVAANVLPESHAESALERAASDCGLVHEDGWHAVRATIASGKRNGFASPREVRL
jgi:hypothetical protein